jgi:caa(3)-type oxidase subunit IV
MNSAITNKNGIFAALFFFMALQIGLSKWGGLSSTGHIIAGLTIASIMTILVAVFFMGLKEQLRLIKITALFPLLLLAIMFSVLVLDILVFMEK